MRKILSVVLMAAALWISFVAMVINSDTTPTLHMIGDSTMADKPGEVTENPERGWGQKMHLFFKPEFKVVNYAKNGRSSKSFISEGLWDEAVSQFKKGDFLIIQFGHNDQKVNDPR